MTDEIARLNAEIAELRASIERIRQEGAEADGGVAEQCMAQPLVPIGGGEAMPGPFEPVYADGVVASFDNCVFCAERQFVDCGTMSPATTVTEESTGYIVLTLTHPTNPDAQFNMTDASLDFVTSGWPPANANDAETKIPLFHMTNGVVDVDLRAVPTGVLAR